MAQPRFFVPGPSVNPSLGVASRFIENLQRIGSDARANRLREEQLEQDRLFKQQQADRAQSLLDFQLAAPERAIAEEQRQRQQANRDAKLFQQAVSGAGGSLVDPFLANAQTQKLFADRGITDPAEQRRMVEEFAGGNRSLFSDPRTAGQAAFDAVVAGGGSLEEAQLAQQGAVDRIFGPPLDPTIAAKLLETGSTGSSNLIGKLFGTGSTRSGKPVSGVPNLADQEEFTDVLTGRMNIEDARGGGTIDSIANFFGIGDETRSTFDFFDRDLDQGDVQRVVGTYSGEYPQYAIVGALRSIVNPDDGTLDQQVYRNILDNPDSQDAKDFRAEIRTQQEQAERTRAGSTLGRLSAQETVDLARLLTNDRRRFNSDIISRTAPRAATFEERLAGFRNFLGDPDPVTPNVAPDSNTNSQTGSAQLDNLIQAATTANAPSGPLLGTTLPGTTAEPDPEIVGAPPGRDQQIADRKLLQPAIDARVAELEAEIANLEKLPFKGPGVETTIRSMKEEIRDLKRRD